MEFFEKTGKKALGSRLRHLTSKVTDEAAKIYSLYGLDFVPKWYPVFFIVAEEGEKSITEIATEIGHSQPSVTKIVKEMCNKGYLETKQGKADKRQSQIKLTKKGEEMNAILRLQCEDLDNAMEEVVAEASLNLWEALKEWEFLLDQKSLLKRVIDQKKTRESKDVAIVPYEKKYAEAFRNLNEEWISKYFVMEEADYKALDNPQSYILDKGGKILVALYQNEPVGVCALIKMNDSEFDFELAKMAVSPKAQGKSIGFLLGQAIKKEAKKLGAKTLYLESNTSLKPAINLYYKLGFQKIVGRETPYERCNIQMLLHLDE